MVMPSAIAIVDGVAETGFTVWRKGQGVVRLGNVMISSVDILFLFFFKIDYTAFV